MRSYTSLSCSFAFKGCIIRGMLLSPRRASFTYTCKALSNVREGAVFAWASACLEFCPVNLNSYFSIPFLRARNISPAPCFQLPLPIHVSMPFNASTIAVLASRKLPRLDCMFLLPIGSGGALKNCSREASGWGRDNLQTNTAKRTVKHWCKHCIYTASSTFNSRSRSHPQKK